MSVVLDILRTWRTPRQVQRRRLSAAPREDRALAVLMAACALNFVAQWPRLAREAHLEEGAALDVLMGGALLGWLFIAPLAFYAIAFLTRMALKFAGVRLTGFQSRMALFWALLAAVPAWLLNGLVAGLAGPGPALTLVGLVAFAAFVVFWMAGLTGAAASAEDIA